MKLYPNAPHYSEYVGFRTELTATQSQPQLSARRAQTRVPPLVVRATTHTQLAHSAAAALRAQLTTQSVPA